MVYEYVAEEGQFRVLRRDFARLRAEWRTEALQGRRCVELGDLVLCLLGDEFALEVWVLLGLVIILKVASPHTMLLLARENRALWRHRHHGELGVGRICP
jgi:hypothetical protein